MKRANIDIRYTEDDVWGIFDEEPELILTVSELFVEAITPLTEKVRQHLKKRTPDSNRTTTSSVRATTMTVVRAQSNESTTSDNCTARGVDWR